MKSYKKIISLILVMIIIFGEACLCLSKKSFAESSQLRNVEFKENESDMHIGDVKNVRKNHCNTPQKNTQCIDKKLLTIRKRYVNINIA